MAEGEDQRGELGNGFLSARMEDLWIRWVSFDCSASLSFSGDEGEGDETNLAQHPGPHSACWRTTADSQAYGSPSFTLLELDPSYFATATGRHERDILCRPPHPSLHRPPRRRSYPTAGIVGLLDLHSHLSLRVQDTSPFRFVTVPARLAQSEELCS